MILFSVFATVAVVASLLVIAQPSPIYSVLALIAAFGALSGLYVLLEAPFSAVTQIIVYAGAIMVLFLFVVMLLNVPVEAAGAAHDEGLAGAGRRRVGRLGAYLAVGLGVELVWALTRAGGEAGAFPGAAVSSVAEIGRVLYTTYAFQFEVTSVLILVAMVGAVWLAGPRGPEGPGA
jgi:NADH-quinone oxidoreductase subunit J